MHMIDFLYRLYLNERLEVNNMLTVTYRMKYYLWSLVKTRISFVHIFLSLGQHYGAVKFMTHWYFDPSDSCLAPGCSWKCRNRACPSSLYSQLFFFPFPVTPIAWLLEPRWKFICNPHRAQRENKSHLLSLLSDEGSVRKEEIENFCLYSHSPCWPIFRDIKIRLGDGFI